MLLALLTASTAVAQSPFAPPPPPASDPSAVRGVYNPSIQNNSPATIAPPAPTTSPQNIPTGTTTHTPSDKSISLEEGKIVARIDGQIVLASDVLWQVNKVINGNRDRIPPDKIDEAREAILRQQVMGLIDTKMIYADFRRTVPAENIPTIEENVKQPFEENEIPRLIEMLEVKDRRELADFFAENGTSLADVQRQFFERSIAGEWLRQMAPKPKTVTHEDMLAYYEEHKSEYEYPAQAKWEEIMIRFNRVAGNRATAWQKCAEIGNEVWQKVLQSPDLTGAVFGDIAKKKSHGFTAHNGGLHDWTTKGALRSEPINKALFSLKVGQLSNIIESDQGFHIIRVLERKEAGRTPFTEAQAKIREEIQQKRQQEIIKDELAKLRKKTRVWTIFDGEISSARLEELLSGRGRG